MSVSVLYSECVLGLSPARPAWFLRLALSGPVRAPPPPPPPRAVLCADRVPIVRRYPSSQECARVRKQLPDASALGGGPARGWVTGTGRRLPRAREAWAWAGAAGGGRQYEKAARGPQRQLLGDPHLPVCAPVQPWLSLLWTPAPTSSSATRSPVQPPEPPLHRRRSPDHDPGRPEMTATGALLPVLLLLLAFGHSTYGEPPWRLGSRPLWGSLRCPADHPPPTTPHSLSRAPQVPPVPPNPKPRSTAPTSPSLRHSCVPSPVPGSWGLREVEGPRPFLPSRSGVQRGVVARIEEVWKKEASLGGI